MLHRRRRARPTATATALALAFVALLASAACGVGSSTGDGAALLDGGGPTDAPPAGADLRGATPTDLAPGADLSEPAAAGYTTAVTVFVEPGAGYAPITGAIQGAKKSVDLEMYYLTESSVVSALGAAHKSGRAVRVILEQHPNGPDNTAVYNQLSNAGVPVRWSSPAFAYTHAKSMVVDGKTLIAATMNFTHTAPQANREYILVDTDPADAAEAAAIFAADWDRTTATASRLAVSNLNAREKIQAVIDGAQKELDVEWEELQDSELASHLVAQAKGGVAVRVVLPSTIDNTATGATAKMLAASGVGVRTLASPTMHAKLVLADRASGFIGSQNGSYTSLMKNRELGVIWKSQAVAAAVASAFDSDWSKATPY